VSEEIERNDGTTTTGAATATEPATDNGTKPSVFSRATRRTAKARVALAGPSGSGKTFDALIWATALGERIGVIDTERDSASLYADMFAFDSVAFPPPFKPSRLVKLIGIAAAEGYDVLVIDSLSHFWEGEGGALDMVDAAAARSGGNSFAGWKVATPEFRGLVDAMLGCPMHLIATMRSKMEYVLEADARGKQAPRKVGMQPVMRAGIEYEFTLLADLDLEHRLVVSKSRCAALADLIAPADHVEAAAQRFASWLQEGEPARTTGEEPS
jgi:AAA domain